jgi:hypothetical protein
LSYPLNQRSDWLEIVRQSGETSAAEVARRLDIPSSTLRSALLREREMILGEVENDREGWVYAMSCEHIPGLLKIGMSWSTVEERAGQLYTTSLPSPLIVELTLWSPTARSVERAIHRALDGVRVNPRREWFDVSAVELRTLFAMLDQSPEAKTSPAP